MRTSNRSNRNNRNSKRGMRGTRRNSRSSQSPTKRKTSRKMNRSNKSKNCGCMRRKKSLGKMNKNRNRQSGGFQGTPTTGAVCRGSSTIDRDTSLFQSMFRNTPTPSNEHTLNDMVYALNNSESRGRYAPL